ncbi:hypothetical protein WAI453_000836 [Rhynchosporium graminicola]|uniref:Extracellular membrane protein CFEM domain-containing protein n=1 Tax=Rhynchosporium graminicola TaxID=2792576 RepID=A0A1E1K547_9HELO|nr:uncharacterized protein RCO7_07848 [Rhynchosporium commune]
MRLQFSLPLLGLVLTSIVLAASSSCQKDNCLRAFEGRNGGDKALSFCKTFTSGVSTATTSLPVFIAQCTGSVVARASSACSCFVKTYVPQSTQSMSSISSKPTTSPITPSTSKSSMSSTSSSTSAVSTPSPTAPCLPRFSLKGASETAFNPTSTPFSLTLSCNKLDTQNYTVFSSGDGSTDPFGTLVQGTNATESSLQIPGFSPGRYTITVVAFDTTGNAIIQYFSLLFGSITMPVLVVDESNAPVQNVTVTADATIYPGIRQVGVTDASGIVKFTNIYQTSIGLFTETADNKIGVNGVAGTSNTITIKLIPFRPASDTTKFNESDGITGWTGGVTKDIPLSKRDNVLVIGTNAQYNLQTAHAEPKVYPFTKSVYIKYKFQTAEVPGGYFGTQYNDYFIVTIRSNTGNMISESHSMNELGLGAFDSAGNTKFFTLNMPVNPKTEWVQFDVGVSNVADAALDSQIIVAKLGDLTCDQCGSCETCPGDPMCQPTCVSPPLKSCAFYAGCAEATLQCGAGGYPLAYGQKNCLAFQADLTKYTPAGQDFIWNTMHCLQLALINIIKCDSTCDTAGNAAFDSHPKCYVDSGFCDLPVMDWYQVVKTVGTDLLGIKPIRQILQTGGTCASKKITEIDAEIDGYVQQAKNDMANAAVYLAKALVMKALRKFVQDLSNGVFPIPSL